MPAVKVFVVLFSLSAAGVAAKRKRGLSPARGSTRKDNVLLSDAKIDPNATAEKIATGDELRLSIESIDEARAFLAGGGELSDDLVLGLVEDSVPACERLKEVYFSGPARDNDDAAGRSASDALFASFDEDRLKARCLADAKAAFRNIVELGPGPRPVPERRAKRRVRPPNSSAVDASVAPPFVVVSDTDEAVADTPIATIVRRLSGRGFVLYAVWDGLCGSFARALDFATATWRLARDWAHIDDDDLRDLSILGAVALLVLLWRHVASRRDRDRDLDSTITAPAPGTTTATKKRTSSPFSSSPKHHPHQRSRPSLLPLQDGEPTTRRVRVASPRLADLDDGDDGDFVAERPTRPLEERRFRDVRRRSRGHRHRRNTPHAESTNGIKRKPTKTALSTAIASDFGGGSQSLCDAPLSKTRSDFDADVQTAVDRVGWQKIAKHHVPASHSRGDNGSSRPSSLTTATAAAAAATTTPPWE